ASACLLPSCSPPSPASEGQEAQCVAVPQGGGKAAAQLDALAVHGYEHASRLAVRGPRIPPFYMGERLAHGAGLYVFLAPARQLLQGRAVAELHAHFPASSMPRRRSFFTVGLPSASQPRTR